MLTTHDALFGVALAEQSRAFAGPRSILLVEDDPDLREILAMALERVGYVVATASNGWEALQFLWRGHRPALIICDLHMPVMTGWRFIQYHDADPEIRDIPVVAMSASANKAPESRLDLSHVQVVPKPFEFLDLLSAIQPYVGPIELSSGVYH